MDIKQPNKFPVTVPVKAPAPVPPAVVAQVSYRYSMLARIQRESGAVPISETCNSWTVTNRGTQAISVNGIPLAPPATPGLAGDTYGLAGNLGEIFGGSVEILFAAADTAPAAVYVEKIYLP